MKLIVTDEITGIVVAERKVFGDDALYFYTDGQTHALSLARACAHTDVVHFSLKVRGGRIDFVALSAKAQISMDARRGSLRRGQSLVLGDRIYCVGIERFWSVLISVLPPLCALVFMICMSLNFSPGERDDPVIDSPESRMSSIGHSTTLPAAVYGDATDGLSRLKDAWIKHKRMLDVRTAAGDDAKDKEERMPAEGNGTEMESLEEELKLARAEESLMGCEKALKLYASLIEKYENVEGDFKREVYEDIKRCRLILTQ